MSDIQELIASIRPLTGTGEARETRRIGQTPAIIYGEGSSPQTIMVETKTIARLYRTGRFLNSLYDIIIDGEKTRVIPKDIQLHPVKDIPMHVDFLLLSKDSKVTVEISVIFSNEDVSPGIKKGGILNIVRHSIECLCPSDQIPDNFDVDLSEAEMGDSIHISAVKLPDGVTPVITDRDFTIATIAAPAGLTEKEDDKKEDETANSKDKNTSSKEDS
jgi:large subunit ribosomal protein L25